MTTDTHDRPTIDLRPGDERFATDFGWLRSRHSFSFGHHHDPTNTHHGLLLVNNDDVVAAGHGFDTHGHRDMEIVTWVLEGSLAHQDSTGQSGVIVPGLAQRISAGTGVLHSERNDAWRIDGDQPSDVEVRFVQMWVVPDEAGLTPGYEQADVSSELAGGGLVVVASGLAAHRETAAIRIHQAGAALHVARLQPGSAIELPDSPFLHVFVAYGAVDVEDGAELAGGDAVRMTAAGSRRVEARSPSEVLVWEMHGELG